MQPNRERSATVPGHLDAARRMMTFIDASPSPFHACRVAADHLEEAGFSALLETESWPSTPGRHYIGRGGSLVAWATGPHHGPEAGFRLVGAHTDSPNLRVKPHPDTGRVGIRQVAVEPYGSPLLSSWLGRDLGLSGRVVVRGTAGPEERLLRIDDPILHIPQLAIHLDREVSTEGLRLNPQQHLNPIFGIGAATTGALAGTIAARIDASPDAILSADLMTHDLTPSALVGEDRDLLSAPRLDNLCSSWAGLEALIGAGSDGVEPAQIPMLVLFDHEEVGSVSDRGAASTLLPAIIERIVVGLGGGREELLRSLAASVCCSADNAHATHPNYPDRHEPGHQIQLNGGPVLKVNANLRYATDAVSAATFVLACEQAGVPLQRYAHRGDLPCGSTIGPVTASRLGIPTVDVGAPQLAMHAARELCGSADPAAYTAAMVAFLLPAD